MFPDVSVTDRGSPSKVIEKKSAQWLDEQKQYQQPYIIPLDGMFAGFSLTILTSAVLKIQLKYTQANLKKKLPFF